MQQALRIAEDVGLRSENVLFSTVATTETLEGFYRANDGNDVLDALGRKSPRRMQFPLTEDPSEPTSPGRVSALGHCSLIVAASSI